MNDDIKDFIEELKKREDVVGIILFGSWARGNNRTHSDVDLIVIVSRGYRRAVEYKNEQVFEIIYTTENDAFDYWKKNKDDAFAVWDVAKILYDKDGSVFRLSNSIKEILASGKSAIDSSQLEQFKFDAEDQIAYAEYISATDSTTAHFVLANKVFWLTELFFDIKQMWTPPKKQRLAKIKEINEELYVCIQDFYADRTSFEEKIKQAKKIVSIVFQK